MTNRILILLLMILTLTACGEQQKKISDGVPRMASDSEIAKRDPTKFLAYEHQLSVDTSEEELTKSYQGTINKCLEDKDFNCTILDSSVSTGNSFSAYIHLRINPKGVKIIIETASNFGNIIRESTHVEDLAQPIVDNEKRLKILETHRNNLIDLQNRLTNNIESLIKISEELSKTQSELENTKGNNAHLLQRVNMDIVKINFVVESKRPFWKQIIKSLDRFSFNLSRGVSNTIEGVAYCLPLAMVSIGFMFFIRFLWRRKK